LGIDGGPISAFEYKLAIALGARTGIFEDPELLRIRGDSSISAWKAIAGDPLWSKSPNFIPLIKDPDIPYVFVRTPTAEWPPVEPLRERLAQIAHDNYRNVVRNYMGTLDDAYKPWEELEEDYQLSSIAQVAGLQIILQRGGLLLVPADDVETLLATGKYERVEDENTTELEIETIAQAEHARWCVEKLEGGWRYGKRDNVKKLRPQLISWDELVRTREQSQSSETDKDRAVIRNLTKTLQVLKDAEIPHVLLRKKKAT